MTAELTKSMQGVIAYFEELGPRWGLNPKTCAVHALLYLTGARLDSKDITGYLDLDEAAAKAAIDDLVEWRVVERDPDGRIWTNGEPWDLLFAGMEERRRREIGPALQAIGDAARTAGSDGSSRTTIRRINGLHDLLQDLSALGSQMETFPSSALKGMVRLGGQVSKFLGKGRG